MRKQSNAVVGNKEDSPKKPGEQTEVSDTPTTEEKPTAKRGTKTPTSIKRELGIFVGPTALYKIAYVGGGETPKELGGLWKTKRDAQAAINRYLSKG